MKKIVAFILLVVVGGLTTWFVSTRATPAPDVTLTSLSGQKVALSELHGKVVLVKFCVCFKVTFVALLLICTCVLVLVLTHTCMYTESVTYTRT
jgi:hypothetical protein